MAEKKGRFRAWLIQRAIDSASGAFWVFIIIQVLRWFGWQVVIIPLS